MRCVNALVVLVLSAAIGGDVDAQKTAWRWSVGAGPSMALRNGSLVPQRQDPSGGSFTFDEPFVSGADDGQFNVAVAAQRAIGGTALTFRLEWLFNRATDIPHPYAWGPETPWISMPVRPALLDEMHSLGAGFSWDAMPASRWSPYLITTTGVLRERIGWNPDSSSANVTETRVSYAIFASAGVGLRVPLGRRQLFAEWRRFLRTSGAYGSTPAPITVGIRF